MADEARFWDRIARRYAAKPVADEASYQRKLAITREYLTPRSIVLEFGCGTGSTAIAHAPFVERIDAIDISARMIEIARGKAGGAPNVTFAQAGIEEYQAPDEAYDVVLGMSILHLLRDRGAAIAKTRRLLKPGGVFISSTMCIGDSMRWFGLIAPLGKALGVFPLVKVFGGAELRRNMEDQGFVIERDWLPAKSKALFLVARKPD